MTYDPPAAGPLRQHERARLSILEQVVERGIRSFHEVGRALEKIRDGGLYREEHPTFEAYCLARWGFSRGQTYRLIGAAGVVEDLALPIGSAPANEAQARPLVPLPPRLRREVWADAVEGAEGGQPAAADVAALAEAARAAVSGREGELRLAEMEQREIRRRSGERQARGARTARRRCWRGWNFTGGRF
jgi:hypothetical protein